ncbi:peptidyl-Lys metalloendopeptidase [Clavulina sp. PMI_390]|nr:peptidyl-Lys metalloendopeptidase [Clavulina sp. PMI_390]
MLSAALLAAIAGSSAVLATPSVSVSFSGESLVNGVDNFKVVAQVANTGDETLTLLNDPSTLLTPQWATKSFHIESAEGVVPEFKGVAVKWSAQSAAANKAVTVIEPGKTVSFEHTLSGVYNFTTAGHSTYKIVPEDQATIFSTVDANGAISSLRATVADAHSATLSGTLVPSAYHGEAAKARGLAKRAHSFNGCSSSEQTALNTAATNAQTYADGAYNYLVGISASTTRYATWFGAYTSTRKSLVQTHYSNIRNGQLATDSFDCTCTEADTYAYVYPDDFGLIYLCGYYWKAPATGTDSQAGTLIHESSHFTSNGGTQDYVYGQTAAKSLASSNPSEATMNADNHEYFAENNPAQS